MTKRPKINKTFVNKGDHPFCTDENWLKLSKAIIEFRETGLITKSEFDCYLYLLCKANPRTAEFITNFTEIRIYLQCGATNARKVMKSLRDKGYVVFESEQGSPKFIVYVNYYPLMKESDKQDQKHSMASINIDDIALEPIDKYEAEPISAKNPFADLRSNFKNSTNNSAKSLDIDET